MTGAVMDSEWNVREPLLNVQQVADYLGVCKRTVYNLRNEGNFAPGPRSAGWSCGASRCSRRGWRRPPRRRGSRRSTSSGAPGEHLQDAEWQGVAGVSEVPGTPRLPDVHPTPG